jgi:hypothetical protein
MSAHHVPEEIRKDLTQPVSTPTVIGSSAPRFNGSIASAVTTVALDR